MKYTADITIIVTAAVAVNLRELSRRLDKGDCDGMFKSGLYAIGSAVGTAPTHFVSHGHVPNAYLNAVTDPVRLYTIAKAAWEADGDVFPFTQTQVTNALSKCALSRGTFNGLPESPDGMMTRLGLTRAI